jgi:hypothetical protein
LPVPAGSHAARAFLLTSCGGNALGAAT